MKAKSEENILIKNINQNPKTNVTESTYIIGTYLYSIKGKSEFSNYSCAATTNGNSKDLIIILPSKTISSLYIPFDNKPLYLSSG